MILDSRGKEYRIYSVWVDDWFDTRALLYFGDDKNDEDALLYSICSVSFPDILETGSLCIYEYGRVKG